MFSLFKKISDNPIELYQNIENGKRAKASFEKLEELADGGNAIASYFLALCYACGQVVNEDRNMFVKYLLKSAEGNYPIALARLGDCYYYGEDLEKDCKKGIEYYKKAITTSKAMNERTAIENGVDDGFISDIHYDLYRCYHDGENGIEKNMDDAFYHLDKAAETNGEALFQLALWYFKGYYIDQDRNKAFEYFRMLADDTVLTHESNYESVEVRNKALSGIGEANYYLGLCFENGYGTNAQINIAKYWYRKSAECGNEKAIKRLEELNN